MASLNDIIRGFSSVPRRPTGLCHLASRSRATRRHRIRVGRHQGRQRADITGQFVKGFEASANKHRRLKLGEQRAAHPNSTFRNGSFGSTDCRCALRRHPKHRWRAAERRSCEGNGGRSRIDPSAHPLGEMGASYVSIGHLLRLVRSPSESIKAACSNPLNKGPLCAFQRGCNRLDMNQGRGNVRRVTQRIGRVASKKGSRDSCGRSLCDRSVGA